MKLKKLLLPIAGVASTAAIVAPVVTSCGSGASFDGSKIYIPTIKPAQMEASKIGVGYTETEAKELYFDDLKSNPKIFAEDMKYSVSRRLYNWKHESIDTEKNYTYKMSTSYSNISANDSDFTLSYDWKGSTRIKDGDGDTKVNFNFSVKNMPYTVENVGYSGEDFMWIVHPDEDLIETGNVEITFKVGGYIMDSTDSRYGDVYKFLNKKITVTSETWEDLEGEDAAETAVAIGFLTAFGCATSPISYHLSLIGYNPGE